MENSHRTKKKIVGPFKKGLAMDRQLDYIRVVIPNSHFRIPKSLEHLIFSLLEGESDFNRENPFPHYKEKYKLERETTHEV